jgi:hypothetical protein
VQKSTPLHADHNSPRVVGDRRAVRWVNQRCAKRPANSTIATRFQSAPVPRNGRHWRAHSRCVGAVDGLGLRDRCYRHHWLDPA